MSSNIKQEYYNQNEQRNLKETLEFNNRGGSSYRGGYRGGFNPRRGNNERPFVPREFRDPNSNFPRGKRPFVPREQRENREGEPNDSNFEYGKRPYVPRERDENFRGRRPFRGGRGGRFPKGPRRDDEENNNETNYHNHKTDYTRFKGDRKDDKFGNNNNYPNNKYSENKNDVDFKNNNISYKMKNDGYNIPISNIDKVESRIQQEKFGINESDKRKNSNFDEDLQKPIFKGKISSDYDRKEKQPQIMEQSETNEPRMVGGDVSINIKIFSVVL